MIRMAIIVETGEFSNSSDLDRVVLERPYIMGLKKMPIWRPQSTELPGLHEFGSAYYVPNMEQAFCRCSIINYENARRGLGTAKL